MRKQPARHEESELDRLRYCRRLLYLNDMLSDTESERIEMRINKRFADSSAAGKEAGK